MALTPEIQRTPVAGLLFDRSLGHQFKVLTSPSGDYYWKPHLMALLRRCPNLAYFLPGAEFSDSGSKVLFTRFSGNDELLTKTVGLDEPGVKLPESAYSKLQGALAEFKASAGDAGLTPEESRFIAEFRLPDRQQFPGAYRVLKTKWYSSDRLFVLWGLEPGNAGGVPVIKILPGAGNAPSSRPSNGSSASDTSGKPGGVSGASANQPLSSSSSAAAGGAGADVRSAAMAAGAGLAAGLAGGSSGSGAGQGGGAGRGFGTAQDTAFFAYGRRRWRGCLWVLLPLLLLLLLILLLSQCAPTSCSDGAVVAADHEEAKPNKPDPVPHPSPNPPKSPDLPPLKPEAPRKQKWWREEVVPEEKKPRSVQIVPLPRRTPVAPGAFEVYILKPADLIQRPPAAEVHLGLRYHGEGRVKDVTWTLTDGNAQKGEFLDEVVPFNGELVASMEVDVSFVYVDSDGSEREDGFSFRYVLEGEVTFKERVGSSADKRSPAEKEAARQAEQAAKALKKGA